ncbi:hypothetical protein DIPPA_32860 [Diplonema papillatum]|nr:hypothetical protein DIPPA_32860 [Diplonema papillatum]
MGDPALLGGIGELSDLVEAIAEGDAVRAEEALLCGIDANEATPDGVPLLHLAAAAGDAVIVRKLVGLGARVDTKCKAWHSRSALHVATVCNNAYVASFLISNGADVDVQDADGKTPLHHAALRQHKTLLTYLISKGADINKRDASGSTASEHLLSSQTCRRFEGDISGAVFTEKQLRRLFERHADAGGQLTTDGFKALWEGLDTLGIPLPVPRIADAAGTVDYTRFCVEMLRVAKW